MTPQEQEHLDHVAGSATEHQNCHAQSQTENNARESMAAGDVAKLVDMGMHVVIEVATAYCRVTDGIIGTHTTILGAFCFESAAKEFLDYYADRYYDGESTLDIRSPRTVSPAEEAESHGIDMDDDVPF